MKILFVGYKNPSFWAVTDYIEIALKEMGHDVLYLDYRSYLLPGRVRDRVPLLERWDLDRINRRIRSTLWEFRPELFLVAGGYNLQHATVHEARRAGAVSAVWFADYPLFFERYLQLAPHYDRFFTSGTDALEKHTAAGNVRGHWLPFACLPDLHRRVELAQDERETYESDVAFIGAPYPERIHLMNLLIPFKPAIWGPGWKERLPAGHPLLPFIRGGSLRTDQWIRAISGCKIAMNYMGSSGFQLDPKEEKMANSRVFELLGCEAFQIVDNKEDVLRLFASGRELVCFEAQEEVPEIIGHYLKHAQEREAIAHRARESAVQSHTYHQRLADLIRICGKA